MYEGIGDLHRKRLFKITPCYFIGIADKYVKGGSMVKLATAGRIEVASIGTGTCKVSYDYSIPKKIQTKGFLQRVKELGKYILKMLWGC